MSGSHFVGGLERRTLSQGSQSRKATRECYARLLHPPRAGLGRALPRRVSGAHRLRAMSTTKMLPCWSARAKRVPRWSKAARVMRTRLGCWLGGPPRVCCSVSTVLCGDGDGDGGGEGRVSAAAGRPELLFPLVGLGGGARFGRDPTPGGPAPQAADEPLLPSEEPMTSEARQWDSAPQPPPPQNQICHSHQLRQDQRRPLPSPAPPLPCCLPAACAGRRQAAGERRQAAARARAELGGHRHAPAKGWTGFWLRAKFELRGQQRKFQLVLFARGSSRAGGGWDARGPVCC